jgi:hypothetical protein
MDQADSLRIEGQTVMFVALDGKFAGFIGDHPTDDPAGHAAGLQGRQITGEESPRSPAYLRHHAPGGSLLPGLCTKAIEP